MASEMVRRVRAAIEDFLSDDLTVTTPDDVACMAVEAMREPTQQMIECGGDASNTRIGTWEDAENIWRAMIDAALADQAESV